MSKRVIIVDDSKATRSMVAFTLRRAGYEVVEAESGAQALSAFETSTIDCMITDLNMPGMDGLELVQEVRGRAACRTTPIVMLTTTADMGAEERARVAGATSWLGKPFLPAKLLEVIAGMI